MRRFQAFPVRLPSGVVYSTVVDASLHVVPDVDDYLLHKRLGDDATESTTEAYAIALALFLEWSMSIGKDWRDTPPYLGRFIFWLRHYSERGAAVNHAQEVRGERRINNILTAVRGLFRYMVDMKALDREILDTLYERERSPGLDLHRGNAGFVGVRVRHRLKEAKVGVDYATDDEVVALVRAAGNSRDRFIIIVMWRAGLRRGELTGMRREDVHFVPDSSALRCGHRGEHLHVTPRKNANKAAAKSRHRTRVVPVDWLTVQAYDQYVFERDRLDLGSASDFLLVNLFREPKGSPMRLDAINDLFDRLSRKAQLTRAIHPHMLRHSFATNVVEAGGTQDELRDLLGHAWLSSSDVYQHPSETRLRAAVERASLPVRRGILT